MSLGLIRYTKRSSHWYVRGTVRGQAVFETTGTDDRATAEAIKAKLENELLERSVFGPGATVNFLEAALSYLDDGGEARFLGRYDEQTGRWSLLIGHFDKTPLAKIGQEDADKAARALYPNAKPATRKRQLYIPLSAILHHAEQKGWIKAPRLRHPRVPLSQTKWSTPERLEKLLPHCSPKLRRLVIFLTYTGARISEVLRIDWQKDVSLAQRTVILRRTKNGKARAVHLPDSVLTELAAVPEEKRTGKVFDWQKRHSVYGPLRRACKRAGVEYLPPHQQGRHTYATWLRSYAGLDLKGIMEAGGWDNVQSVARYAHVSPGEAARAADRLPVVQNPCTSKQIVAKPKQRKAKF